MDKNTNIYLVGLMGAGKTTVGRQLARRLGRRFYDSDHEIVARTGVPIPTIFEIEGEAGFRRRESQPLAELSELRGTVMATGGGAVLAEENRHCQQSTGGMNYIGGAPHVRHQRTRNDRNRPLLQVEDPLARLESLHAVRDPLYRATAHLVVEGGMLLAAGITHHILREFNQACARTSS